jgi:putative aldouronate transport system permease protein
MVWKVIKKDIKRNYPLYLIMLPALIYFLIFSYGPLVGLLMAFENYKPKLGFFGSQFVGLKHFKDFFGSYYFIRLLKNTFLISFYDLIVGFPAPIIFALLLNEVRSKFFKKTIQTLSYLPYFVSLVVVCSLVTQFTNGSGMITQIWSFFTGKDPQNLLALPAYFRSIFVGSGIWQNLGYNSIIFIAALAGVDQELYEAAVLDGANRWKQTLHVTLPGISTTIVILFILRCGSLLSVGYEKIILLYGPSTYETGDVISSFVYRKGLQEFNYGYSTAVGLFNSVISLILLLTVNKVSKRVTSTSLF